MQNQFTGIKTALELGCVPRNYSCNKAIKSGIEQGFNEAKDILQQMGFLEGEVATNIDKTYELVQEKLDSYEEDMLDLLNVHEV